MKNTFSIIVAALLAGLLASPAVAQAVLDCPLRDRPFSTSSPLIDILLSPAARGVVEEFGVSFDEMPDRFVSAQAPSFAAILTLREAGGLLRQPPEAVARADAKLRELSVTDADRLARCARYDDERPEFDLPAGQPRILLFEKITGFRDGPSVEAAHAAFQQMAKRNGWAMAATEKGGAISPETLAQFDAVIWNNVSGDVLTLTQRQALRDFVEDGGGFVAVHGSAGDPAYFWDWYADTLIGARFAGHPSNPQFQDARIVVEDGTHPAAADLPDEWVMNDEWYSFRTNPRDSGARIIAKLDESSYSPEGMAGQDLRMGDHPIAWSKIVGKGRMFYSAIGHRPEVYKHPHFIAMFEDAIAWSAKVGSETCQPGQ